MRQDYEKLLSCLEVPEPSAGLFNRVLATIQIKQRRLVVRRNVFCSLGLLVSLVLLIPAWQMVQVGLAESGFLEFFSLLFSDSGMMAASWQNFGMVLLESLPVTGLALLLIAVAGAVSSFSFIITQTNYDVA